jgi:16S rRNA (guanine966-N2)-methyltransferase
LAAESGSWRQSFVAPAHSALAWSTLQIRQMVGPARLTGSITIMRIIAGQRRGHKIDGPRATGRTRPTSDLVRESIFNILGELVVDRTVIDLFAGTGALGLEALSRGAKRAIFVEKDRENVGLIHRNIAILRYEDRASVRHADVYRWARAFEPIDERPIVVFLDPPYREHELRAGRLNPLIAQLVQKLSAGSVVAIEAGRFLDERVLPEIDTWDIRRYSSTRIAIKVVTDAPAEAGSPPPPPTQTDPDRRGPVDDLYH